MRTRITIATAFRFPSGSGEQGKMCGNIDECEPDAYRSCELCQQGDTATVGYRVRDTSGCLEVKQLQK